MKTFCFNVLSHLSNVYLQNTPKFRFASKKLFFLAKKFDFRILLITFKKHYRRYKKPFILTFYPVSVPNHLQKTSKFRFASKKFISGKKIDFRVLLFYFKEASQEV